MMVRAIFIINAMLFFVFGKAIAQEKPIVLVGATIIDVTNYGNSFKDIPDAVVVIRHGKIIAAGGKEKIHIPKGAYIVNVPGKYIIPGLIDCFSVIGTQGQANSHLYYGVTTVVAGPGDDRRKGFFTKGDPSPHIKTLVAIPSDNLEDELEKKGTLSPGDIAKVNLEVDHIDSLKKAGISTLLLEHKFPQELIPKIITQCRKYQINTIGEMQYARYTSALKYGINSLVHTSRYILGAFPDSLFLSIRNENEYDARIRAKYSNYLYSLNIVADPLFNQYAHSIAASNTALMPTLSLLYTSLPDHKNIWKEPAAHLTDPTDVFLPMDTASGRSTSWISAKNALRQIEIEKAFIKAGIHYITGSGADAFGALPGISEHIEIAMLHRCGLTNRQALAAATNNPSVFNRWTNIGLIGAGRNADILILSRNPVEDLENLKMIDMIWLNGKLINRKSLLVSNIKR